MEKEIKDIEGLFFEEIKDVKNLRELEEIKIKYLGKKGKIQFLLSHLKKCKKEEKPLFGKLVNDLKEEISEQIKKVFSFIHDIEEKSKLEREEIDINLPGRLKNIGNLHPVTKMMDRMIDVLVGMGFSIQKGPDLESDYYNFEALNFESDHPARDMQDTFYITEDLLLRTHTSNVQVRVMEKFSPPIRVIASGRCFRNENVSSRSHVFFHQVEGFYIDKDVSFSSLFSTMDEFWDKVFNYKIKTRYRPSYFPFVEPGMEGDIECIICKGKGCKICKNSGWLEIFGAGMIHPNVLKYGNIDPEKYNGYAFGLGIERLAMLYYGIEDIRIFTENDFRFLNQI
ncbi:MAG: phenylalanyl-tRNA synthetase subunit alpha [Chlamydiae bacterium SM23_39]|nr:MAG: phenylalanyl-tRNA synthetase subunit alpha [Chlamydiae bacterium SM23_39]